MNKAPQVEILMGAARSRKATQVRRRYLSLIESCPPREVLLLVPTGRRLAATVQRLLQEHPRGVLYDYQIQTFPRYAEALLERLTGGAVKRVSGLQRQMLLADSLAQCRREGRIEYFEPIADRAGLIEILGGFIHRLKSRQISPEKFAASCRGASPSLVETAAVYQSYQQRLERHGLYDDAGLFWQTCEHLAAAPQAVNWPRHVLVDGFQDLDAPEISLLAMLAERAESTVITLPCDPTRAELFDPTIRLLERLRAALGKVARVTVTPSATGADAGATGEPGGTGINTTGALPLSLLEERIFDDDAPGFEFAAAAATTDGAGNGGDSLEMMEVAGQTQEVEHIARRLKTMLLADETLRPEDIAIILRRGEPYESLIADIFPRYGLPITGTGSLPLTRVAVTRWILALLELPANDYPTADLTAVLRSAYLDAALLACDERALELGDIILHQHQILSGRQAHLAGIEGWLRNRRNEYRRDNSSSGDFDNSDGSGAQPDELAAIGESFRRAIGNFFALLDAMPGQADHTAMVDCLRQLLDQLGLRNRAVNLCDGSARSLEQLRLELAALDKLDELLDEISHCQPWLGNDSRKISLADFAALLRRAMSDCTTMAASSSGPHSAISVMDVFESRALSFRVVVLPGLAQGVWPQVAGRSLLESAENERTLQRAGLEIIERRSQMANEKFLFYMAATRAAEKLIVTRPAGDEKGRPIAGSAFWDELVRLAGEKNVRRIPLSAVSMAGQRPFNVDELRRAALLNNSADENAVQRELAAVLAVDERFNAILSGAAVELERESFRPFGRYDGIIDDPALLAGLRKSHPGERLHSISRLQDYLACPFRFFAAHLLRLSSWELPDEETLDAPDAGALSHDILRDFHAAYDSDFGKAMREQGMTAADIMLRAASARFAAYERELSAHLPALWKLQRDEMTDRLLAYVEEEMKRRADKPWRPLRLEWGFGMTSHLEEADERSSPHPLEIQTEHGPAGFRGRIDRIDVSGHERRAAIIDYKSGAGYQSQRNLIRKGLSLQMPVYLLAVRQLLLDRGDIDTIEASHYYLASAEYKEAIAAQDGAGAESMEQDLAATLSDVFGRIRCGEFPPETLKCPSYCDYRELCRAVGWRIARKLAAAAAAAAAAEE